MSIINIIAAPRPKKAIWYDVEKDELVIDTADIIGLVEIQNPDNLDEIAVVPMYMVSDDFGTYRLPQVNANFIEFIDINEQVDYGDYEKSILDIKTMYEKFKKDSPEVVEVETQGNISKIKRIIRHSKPEVPKSDS